MNDVTIGIPETCRTVILGATWFGCGAAVSAGEGTLILERSAVPGRDFCLTFEPGREWEKPLRHPLAEAFREELKARHALENNRVEPGALAPVLANWCIERKIRILFSCDLIEKKKNAVTFRAVDGVHTVRASRIIDAEVRCGKQKFLTAFVTTRKEGGAVPFGQYPAFELCPLLVPPNGAALRMKLAPETPWPEAREKLRRSWLDRSPELAECQLHFSAPEFFFDHDPNPLAALDRGLMTEVK